MPTLDQDTWKANKQVSGVFSATEPVNPVHELAWFDLSTGLIKVWNNITKVWVTLDAAAILMASHLAAVNPHGITREMIGALGDAPNDGKLYLRRNGLWEELIIS